MNRPPVDPGQDADSHVAAWAFACALSPHPRIRLADVVDGHVGFVNSYGATTPASPGSPPAAGRPYAIHLTDPAGRFRLLGFDFDAKRGPVTADVARLQELLTRAGLPHVVCASGPGGGRHVWVALADPVGPATARRIALGLSRMLPSYDPTPLTNPRTGALRPPLAPHRAGGQSEVIVGQLDELLRPSAAAAAVLRLDAMVRAEQPPTAEPAGAQGARAISVNEHGHRRMRGPRRDLTARVRAALDTPIPAGADTSTILRTVLCGAVYARWTLADIRAELATAPGLEHVRSRAGEDGHRQPYSRHEQHSRLRAEWDRAVGYVADHPVEPADAPEFEARQAHVTAAVAAVQRRADAAPGRWARGGGAADRRVLDVACLLMLTARRLDIELDIRRAAEHTGLSRETARTALHRLAVDGWLRSAAPAAGIHGAHWALPAVVVDHHDRPAAELSTSEIDRARSQVNTRPPTPVALHSAWSSHLTYRTTSVLHDALTHAGLGLDTARVYQALTTAPIDLLALITATGYSTSQLARSLDRLAGHRLAKTDRRGRWRILGRTHTSGTRLGRVARALGVIGLLVDRRRGYAIERQAWAWWTDELAWRRASTTRKRRAPGAGQLELIGIDRSGPRQHYGRHPVDHRGRGDYAAALAHLTAIPPERREAS
ncbi:hypothetical protein [Micromonospora sp.]|uniref:hypothetical protein n=1 Tax=Micromonospora sp. TaxID=1876 RepID=UPI003B3B1561